MREAFEHPRTFDQRTRERMHRHQRHAHTRALRIFFFALGLPACVGTTLFFLFFSNVFSLEYVDIDANSDVDARVLRSIAFAQTEKKVFRFFPQKNIFAFDTGEYARSLDSSFFIDEFSVRKKFPHTLHVRIRGRPFRAVWYTRGYFYDVSRHGVITRSIPFAEVAFAPAVLERAGVSSTPPQPPQKNSLPHVPLFVDDAMGEIALGETVLSQEALLFFIQLPSALEKIGVSVSFMKLAKQGTEISIVTREGWVVRMTRHEPLKRQVENLSRFLDEKIKKKRGVLRLVDVRFENRIYYTVR